MVGLTDRGQISKIGLVDKWKWIDVQSPATSIVLRQDYDGIVTMKVKYPGEDTIETTGHTSIETAVDEMMSLIRKGSHD